MHNATTIILSTPTGWLATCSRQVRPHEPYAYGHAEAPSILEALAIAYADLERSADGLLTHPPYVPPPPPPAFNLLALLALPTTPAVQGTLRRI